MTDPTDPTRRTRLHLVEDPGGTGPSTASPPGDAEDFDEEATETFADQSPDAVLWSTLDDGLIGMFPGDEDDWTPPPLLAEWVGLSPGDLAWMRASTPFPCPDVLDGVEPEEVEDALTFEAPDKGGLRSRVLGWREAVDDLLGSDHDDPDYLLDEHSLGVEYAGVLVRGGHAWPVLEVEFDRPTDRDALMFRLAAAPLWRVLDMSDGPMGPGLAHPYSRFGESAGVLLDMRVGIEGFARALAQTAATLDGEAALNGTDEAAPYLVATEGQRGRVFAVERADTGRVMLRAVLRCSDVATAQEMADLLGSAVLSRSFLARGQAIRYAEHHLSAAAVIAVRQELDTPFTR